jgi:flagellar biosynthesis/type III secretory pathway protein FliH
MSIERARIIKGLSPQPSPSQAAQASGTHAPRANATMARNETFAAARRLPRPVVDAHAEAASIVADARAHADDIVAAATANASKLAEQVAKEAREKELARLAAEVIVVRAGAERRAERELDRTIELAVLLAERLVGEAIAVEPARISALAAHALSETRGARQMRIEVNPDDAVALHEALASLGVGVATVEPSPELSRGSLVVHTELGRVDARLTPQLSRLAEALREVLRGPAGGQGSAQG